MLHKPATTKPPAVSEHQKRVWWTTFLMDTMTSSEVGLKATLRFKDTEQLLPSSAQLRMDEQRDFRDPEILTAHIKLCDIRNDILETAGRLQQQDFANYHQAIHYPLCLLEQWRLEVPAQYSFDFSQGIPTQMLQLVSMRSLASLYLRYHQGYILLIRPIFFKLLAIALGKDADESPTDSLIDFSSRCLEFAKCNMRILMGLSNKDKIGKLPCFDSFA